MKVNLFILFTILCTFYSCEKEEELSETLRLSPPRVPKDMNIDLNNDAIDDLKIYYASFTWDGINSSGSGIAGIVEPINNSAILVNRHEKPLFNQIQDTIKLKVSEPLSWEMYVRPELVNTSNLPEKNNLWPKDWNIMSSESFGNYYLGIKLQSSSNPLIGWLKFDIDKATGVIQLVDQEFTSGKFVVINR